MADIFISYSQQDREQVARLASYLEAGGWSVWWDKHLGAGDAYRDEIMEELTAARAVIVLWTRASITSDFVRAEAGRAKADGKLIPVKSADVGYGDIPLPFGEMHTEALDRLELVRAAIVGQLAKPQFAPSALAMAGGLVRYQVLTWLGILGGAITFFANIQGVLNLSAWARWLMNHWQEMVLWFWSAVGSLIGIRPPPGVALMLSFLLFCFVTAAGARRLATSGELARHDRMLAFKMLLVAVSLWAAITIGNFLFSDYGERDGYVGLPTGRTGIFLFLFYGAYPIWLVGRAYDRETNRDRKRDYLISIAICLAIAVVYLSTFFLPGSFLLLDAIISVPYDDEISQRAREHLWKVDPSTNRWAVLVLFAAVATLQLLPFAVAAVMLIIAPPRALGARLGFMAMAVVVLAALNQLSHLAPEIGSFLKPPL